MTEPAPRTPAATSARPIRSLDGFFIGAPLPWTAGYRPGAARAVTNCYKLFRLPGDPQVGLGRLPAVREKLLRVFVADRAGDDHVLALLPVRRGRHAMLRRELHRVECPHDLVEVAAG